MPQAAYVESEVINVKYYICDTCIDPGINPGLVTPHRV